ncbi:DUF1028 domain-containing protein [Saccharothrix variisporea]|nr:DUF1028 domain-containing protein [Saccharothrix variisporea]
MTYSIVARDPVTGCLGVAVQSGVLAIGTRVPAASAGVGAVAAQAGSQLWWRTALLDVLGAGMTAEQAVTALATQPGVAEAQFAVVDSRGGVAAFTGPDCIPAAGHALGDGVSVQGNMMASPTVWPAMLTAYESAGSNDPTPFGLASRLVAALAAAEAEGGDIRGPQAAALLVVGPARGSLSTGDWDDPFLDLRVDDSRDPVADLTHLLTTARAHRHLIKAGTPGVPEEEVVASLRAAAEGAPEDPSALRSAGIGLALRGQAEAFDLLGRALALEPRAARWVRAAAQRKGGPHADALTAWLDDRESPV